MSTINESMLEALQNAKNKLSTEANDLIKQFVLSKLHPDGGFIDRAGNPDLYYSVFGYSLIFVYDIPLDFNVQTSFLKSKIKRDKLDLIHAVSLVRSYILVEATKYKQSIPKISNFISKIAFIQDTALRNIIKRVEKECKDCYDVIQEYKSADGGYNQNAKHQEKGTVYAGFLVWSLMEEMNLSNFSFLDKLDLFRLADGSYVNELDSKSGITSTTSAGLLMMLADGKSEVELSTEWLKKRYNRHGGFLAAENLPVADVLSTATALTALNIANESMNQFPKVSEFINLHWDESGGFFGSIADMQPDIEYTFYALLSLGLV